jgi:hypothetical protein
MDEVPCCHCGVFFKRSPRHKNQNYCMEPECRKARKAAWKREKMRLEEQFRLNHHLSHQKWARAHPGYWKAYRLDHPEKVERNRRLQIIRNRKRDRRRKQGTSTPAGVIAKVDASKPYKFKPIGQYYLVPVIAKVDALKVRIYEVTAPYP